ncbi:MAG: hypothetical protein K8I04_15515 [Gammaproteobacteria bacterium]|nr:hypothetical protein [Gammaproteobacteria bacterium]
MTRTLTRIAALAFALAVLLIGVSAYIRLAQGGLGCAPWPDCYALLGEPPRAFPVASLLHRVSASLLGILVLLLTVGAWRQRQGRMLSIVILAITIALAALGVRSGGLLMPAVVLGNFFGGLLLATLLGGWLLRGRGTDTVAIPGRAAPLVLLVLSAAVIATGIGSSAFYGNAVCPTLFDCGTLHSPLQLGWFEPLALDAGRHVVTPAGAATLQWLHRLSGVALMAGFALLLFTLRRYRAGALAGLAVTSMAVLIGLTATGGGVPIAAAVIHSLSGLALMLVLLPILRRRRGTHPGR